ncbi:hypothetical protein [Paenibacillus sp. FSL L8-0641]|uniref:hypothetical protein n=1 Tax=Paenibacillus sp. FSL L8-0641 TaxID=2921605 RepID=UPI0030F63A5C
MPKIDIPIPEVPGASALVEYETDENKVECTISIAGHEIAKQTIEATAANEEGFGFFKAGESRKLGGSKFELTFEFWVRWKEQKVVFILLYTSPIGKGKIVKWGDF